MPISTHKTQAILFAMILCAAMPVAHAQEGDAASYKLGETDLFPSVRIDYLQNSNAFLQPNDVTSATDITISPDLVWVADRRLLSLEGSYQGRYNVSSEEELNFTDHRLALNAEAELTSKKRLSGAVSLDFGHEEFGTNLTRGAVGNNSDPVEFVDFEAVGSYRYGAVGAKGNVLGGLLLENFNYNSRKDVTTGRSYTRIEPFAEFSLRLSGDTRLLSQIRYGAFRYENDQRDRDDLSLLAGMEFDTTGKSGGSALVGAVQSQLAASDRSDQTELVVRGSLFWEPTSFSRLELDMERGLDNVGSSLIGTTTLTGVNDLVVLRWLHDWSSRVSHIAVIRNRVSTRTCPDRDISTVDANLELNVQIRRWLSVGLSGSSAVRDVSNCPGTQNENADLNYERTRVGAHLRATL